MRHKDIKRRFVFVFVIIIIMAVAMLAIEYSFNSGGKLSSGGERKQTIRLWYTDEALTDYFNSKALDFYEETDIRVETRLVSGIEYLEEINRVSTIPRDVHSGNNQPPEDGNFPEDEEIYPPDVFVISNDSLEKAYLAGLASELENQELVNNDSLFARTAKEAASYKGKYVGCPLYFETAALLYNKTYLEQIAEEANAQNAIAADAAATAEETGETNESAESDDELITADALVPETIADILEFADSYSAPENVEYFFKWDVSDIFYNYFFVGDYISVGGACGDDRTDIDIYNTESVATLKVYQDLNQFFSIDTKETRYDTVIADFIAGKSIYTIATSDCMKALREAGEKGEFTSEYGIAMLPQINQNLTTRGMSVTNVLAVNGFSTQKKAANRFVEYMALNCCSDLYDMTGKLPAVKQKSYSDAHIEGFVSNYDESVPIPKLVETSNFWVELETCFARIWNGEDANSQLKKLSEQIKTQLAGESVTEELIDTPDVELLPAEEYEEVTQG